MKTIYFISGLGADHRLFKKQIQANIPIIVLPWLIPEKNESIEIYAERMTHQIPPNRDPVILGGVSFGGIIAIEMSRHIPTEKIIILSSVKTSSEIPIHIKTWKYFPIYKILGGNFLKKAGILFRYFFGTMPLEEKATFLQMVKDSDSYFVEWAADKICHWKNKDTPANLTHIHGSSDLIFPISKIKKPFIEIPKGTHLMVLTSSEKVNALLKAELSE